MGTAIKQPMAKWIEGTKTLGSTYLLPYRDAVKISSLKDIETVPI